jgi:hypothetical protein
VRSIGTFALIFLLCPIGFCQAPNANSRKGDQVVPTLQRESPALIPAPPTEDQPSQNPANPSLQYAPRAILLLSPEKDVEAVMPILMTINGQPQLQYVPVSRIKEFMDHGGLPIRLGDVLSALGEATQTISKLQADNVTLQAENDNLWKVAMKDAPRPQPQTVVVQQPQPSALEKYMLLRALLPPPAPAYHPIQIQPPQNPRLQTNCTTTYSAGTAYTNCH